MSFCINPHCLQPQNPDNVLFCQSCASELLLEGRYRVIGPLGGGGFGKTYEVRDYNNTSNVLKVLINNSSKTVELFQREAQVLSQLNHPGIPKVESNGYFLFYPKNSQQPLHCLVMEKIEGLDLREYIKQRGNRPINGEVARRWLTELVTILHQVHSQGIWHRDIKPQNIIFKPDGQLALIDFGAVREGTGTEVATHAGGGGTSISSTGYTPVEQLNGEAIRQSDFFALGRTFVFLLTAKEPTDRAIYDAFNDELRWRDYARDIPPGLASLIDQMMVRLPRDRPANTQVILQRLANIDHPQENQDKRFNSTLGRELDDSSKSEWSSTPEPQTQSWRSISTLSGHAASVRSVTFSLDSQTLVSGSDDNTIKLWHLGNGNLIRTFTWKSGFLQFYREATWFTSVAISSDGQTIIGGSLDKSIKLWNSSNGNLICNLTGHSDSVYTIALSPDNQTLVSGSRDNTIKVWNLPTRKLTRNFTGHSDSVYAVAHSPDNQTLVSGSRDNTIKVWNLVNGRLLRTFTGHLDWVRCVAISPDGNTLASGSNDNTIKLWHLGSGGLIRTFTGQTDWITSLVISPDGQTLVSGSRDKTIKLWHLGSGKLICTLAEHLEAVCCVAISPDSQTLASSSDDGAIKIWQRI